MNKGRVGEERGGKEMDGCSLTMLLNQTWHNVHFIPVNSMDAVYKSK
jgi:hypothetical protein